jgi:N-acetylated-alpha-linked acidic dipeptidase
MRPDKRELLADVSITEPWALVERFANLPREEFDDIARGADEIISRLAALGVPTTVYEPDLFLSLPRIGRLEVDGESFEAKPPSFTKPVPEGLQAPLVLVEGDSRITAGYAPNTAHLFGADYVPSPGMPDVRGCLAMFRGTVSTERVVQLEAHGAAGVIAINPGEFTHWGGGCPFWGTPDLDDLPTKISIPVVAVNKRAGERLLEVAKTGGSARIVTELQEEWVKSKLPVVEIPGSEAPEQFVLLHGHYCAWDVGVGDNATGNAAMLEIARVLWMHRAKLKRSIRITWWPGHSHGRFGGSTWYADRFAIDLVRNCLAQINCDSPGCRWATSYEQIPWMAENAAFVTQVVRDAVGLPASGKRPPPANDYSFTNLGITGYLSSSSRIPATEIATRGYYYVMGNGGNIEWHTVNDRLEIADRDVLFADMRIYLLADYRNANATLLPYDFTALLTEYAETVRRYQAAAGDRFDLSAAVQAVAELAERIAHFNEAVTNGEIPPSAANGVLLKLSRHLVPLNYCRSTRFRRDLALPQPPLPWLSVAEELDRYTDRAIGFALTQLQRGSNHVVGELLAARELVEGVLATLV